MTLNNELFCFTKDKNKVDSAANYILLLNESNLNCLKNKDGDIQIKRWIKHPQENIEQTIDEIINSWKNNFNFKEEVAEEGERDYVDLK